MIEPHEYCFSPENQEIKIWKYMDFTKFIDFIMNKTLYFTRSDRFGDSFEGTISAQDVTERNSQCGHDGQTLWTQFGKEIKKTFFVNCWHINENESYAMWKIYLNSQNGIALQTTYSKLYKCLNEVNDNIYLSTVKYDGNGDWGTYLDRMLHKKSYYSYEQELRAIVNDNIRINEDGLKIEVNINNLIENIYVAPSSPIWFQQLVKNISNYFNFDFTPINSALDCNPIY
ncbi:hypothetical protein [Paludibacter jiangxiensis]|uniref:DUF2971 domain-containing protein n=1 Tax=Paludibacter jiangxiensis TaxID=681398 RepID=A0A170ZBH6_9BACT|nr:hypothetical protein [Paludibacter jiangxiensis]GAT62492.1 hypothetical protein PJIAN_251 [Paludibacter jiangxiensis]